MSLRREKNKNLLKKNKVANNDPLVSVITVVKDLIASGRKDYFCQCVASVKMQSYPNIEHIVVDGASTDGTVQLLRQMNLNFISEPDNGIHDATNKGIKLAKGKYVILLCSDDFYISPTGISDSVAVLEETNADFSYSPYYNLKNNKIDLCMPKFNCCFFSHPVGTPGVVFRKDALESVNYFDVSYKCASDFDLLIRMLLKGKVPAYVKNPFVVFRVGGISSNPINCRKERIRIIETDFSLTHKQALISERYCFFPKKVIQGVLSKTKKFPDRKGLLLQNKKNFFKYIRRLLITLRLRKGKRCIRLLGITFYAEENY